MANHNRLLGLTLVAVSSFVLPLAYSAFIRPVVPYAQAAELTIQTHEDVILIIPPEPQHIELQEVIFYASAESAPTKLCKMVSSSRLLTVGLSLRSTEARRVNEWHCEEELEHFYECVLLRLVEPTIPNRTPRRPLRVGDLVVIPPHRGFPKCFLVEFEAVGVWKCRVGIPMVPSSQISGVVVVDPQASFQVSESGTIADGDYVVVLVNEGFVLVERSALEVVARAIPSLKPSPTVIAVPRPRKL